MLICADATRDNQVIDPCFFQGTLTFNFQRVNHGILEGERDVLYVCFAQSSAFLYGILSESFESTEAQV